MNAQALRLLILAAMLVFTFGAGFYTKGKFVAAAEVKVMRADAKESAGNAVASVTKSTAIEKDITKDAVSIDAITAAARNRVSKYQPKEPAYGNHHLPKYDDTASAPLAPQVAPADCPVRDLLLDVGTVRLLNAASEGRSLDSTGVGDGQERAAAEAAR